MNALGLHTLMEFYGCEPAILDNRDLVREILLEAAKRGEATIVSDLFHQFSPQGISGVVVIAESHLAIHTWPEHGYAAVDLFSCSNKIRVDEVEKYIQARFRATRFESRLLERGLNALSSKI